MTASFADQEIWHVMIARDDLKRMNVDQLDDAFRLDIVDASTLVWKQGMETWRRLGSIAGIEEDEPETIAREPARPFGPPSAPPPPRPRPVPPARSVAPAVNPFAATLQPHAVNPFGATTPYLSNAPASVFPAPKAAPAPQLIAPNLYAMPKGRVKLDSADLNFHGKSVHWGRWLVGLVLLTAGVLAAYRQNYLREGARKIGLENKYLYGEKRAVGWVTAKAPNAVQAALRQLKLLPAPNAAAPVAAAALTPTVAAAAPAPAPSPETVVASAPTPPPASDPGVKTVSLDSLPVLGAEPEASPEPVATPAPKSRTAAPAPKGAVKAAKKVARDEPAPKPAKAKSEPAPKPAAKAAKAPPPTMSSPLKAAIWQAMQEDSKKGK